MHAATTSRHRRIGLAALAVIAVIGLASCEAGWVNPVAGDGTAGTTTATVPDAQARFTTPSGVVAIPGGGSYVYDSTACAIYKEYNGQVSVFAGTPGTCGNSGDGGAATSATLQNDMTVQLSPLVPLRGPGNDNSSPIAVGPDGSVYFVQCAAVGVVTVQPGTNLAEYTSQIRRIRPDGTIESVGNQIVSSFMQVFSSVTVTPGGTILANILGIGGSSQIVSIGDDGTQTPVTTTAQFTYAIAAITDTTVATLGMSTDDIVDLTTGIATPTAVAGNWVRQSVVASPDGTVYIGDNAANTITAIAPDGTTRTIAGTGTADPGTTAQSGNGLDLNLTPTGLALTPNNGLLISSGHVVYRLADPAHTALPLAG